MGNVNVKKRGSVYQYEFEVPKITSKRRRITKSGFKTKREAMEAGLIAQHNFFFTGRKKRRKYNDLCRLFRLLDGKLF